VFASQEIQDEAFRYYARLRNVHEYIASNLSQDVSLSEAAAVAGMEKKYFSTFFHKKVGICFRYWLMSVRVEEARRLMRLRDFSITEIAFMIGFRDLRTFERAFKRCTGLTPREFKRLVEPH
jgi:AraC family transcriptional regulator